MMRVLIIAFSLALSPNVYSKKALRNLAQVEGISYENSTTKNFQDIKIYPAEKTKFFTFQSFEKKTYILDCPGGSLEKGWTCFSPCEGGELQISFSEGYEEMNIAPFQIRPRLCDGSESDDDPILKSRKSLVLKRLK